VSPFSWNWLPSLAWKWKRYSALHTESRTTLKSATALELDVSTDRPRLHTRWAKLYAQRLQQNIVCARKGIYKLRFPYCWIRGGWDQSVTIYCTYCSNLLLRVLLFTYFYFKYNSFTEFSDWLLNCLYSNHFCFYRWFCRVNISILDIVYIYLMYDVYNK